MLFVVRTCANETIDEKLRVTKKPIPRYTSYVDVKRHDLYLPEEKELYADFPNYDSNLASIKVPSLAYWSRLLLGSYQELFIVVRTRFEGVSIPHDEDNHASDVSRGHALTVRQSPESSPTSSQADEDSRRTSPTTSFGRDSSDETRLGASQESGTRQ